MSSLWIILTIFCLFILKVKAEKEEVLEELGLAEMAFDDQYLGCRQAMEDQIKTQGIFEAEMSANKNFWRAWKEAEQIWGQKMKDSVDLHLPEGFSDLHAVAIVAYTGFIRKRFNKAVKSAGQSYRAYMDDFHFKFLHYYLTVALQLLYKDCKGERHTMYQGYEDLLYWLPSGTTRVKFGHFLHTSSSHSVASQAGNTSFFTVLGCSGVPVDRFSEYPDEEEVVFPGYEIFTVMQTQGELNEFYLDSTGRWCSNFNCALIQGRYLCLHYIQPQI
ncbi:T-cell ecto-ADP-ribosyltransferase 1-like [Lithobates pipiens]